MRPSIRHFDWDRRLRLAIEAARDRQFRWGRHDCCLFAADLVQAMTGWDPAESLRGTYASEIEAAHIINGRGGIAEVVSELLATEPFKPAKAQRGDVVLLRPLFVGHLEQLGVCVGDSAVVAAETGLLHRCMGNATKAWRLD